MNPSEIAHDAMNRHGNHNVDEVADYLPVTNPLACERTGIPARENWWNWVPANAVETVKTARDPTLALHGLVADALGSWFEQYATDGGIEGLTANHELGAYLAVSRRVVRGAATELAAADSIDARILTSEETLARTNYDSVTALENAGIDMMDENGVTYQVKSSTEVRDDKDKKEADEMIWVIVDDDDNVVRVE